LNRLQCVLGIALVVGGGLTAGFLSYSSPIRTGVATSARHAARAGRRLHRGGRCSRPLPVPSVVPDLTFPNLRVFDLAARLRRSAADHQFLGHVVRALQEGNSLLRDLRQRYRGQHLEVVGIALDFYTAVQQYLQKTPIDYPVLIGEQGGFTATQQFGVQAVLPFSVFADSHSRIVAVKVGELHREEADFILSEIGSLDLARWGWTRHGSH